MRGTSFEPGAGTGLGRASTDPAPVRRWFVRVVTVGFWGILVGSTIVIAADRAVTTLATGDGPLALSGDSFLHPLVFDVLHQFLELGIVSIGLGLALVVTGWLSLRGFEA